MFQAVRTLAVRIIRRKANHAVLAESRPLMIELGVLFGVAFLRRHELKSFQDMTRAQAADLQALVG